MSDTSGFTNFSGPTILPEPIRGAVADVVDRPLLPRSVRDRLGGFTPSFGGRAHFVPIDDDSGEGT